MAVVGQPAQNVRRKTAAIEDTEAWLDRVVRKHMAAKDTQHRLVTICSGTLLASARASSPTGNALPTMSCWRRCMPLLRKRKWSTTVRSWSMGRSRRARGSRRASTWHFT